MSEKNKLKTEFILLLCVLLIGTIGNTTLINGSINAENDINKLTEYTTINNSEPEEKIEEDQDSENNAYLKDISELSSRDIDSFITPSDLDSEVTVLKSILDTPFLQRYHPDSLFKVREDNKIEFVLKYDDQFNLLSTVEHLVRYDVEITQINQYSSFLLIQVPKNLIYNYQQNFFTEALNIPGVKYIEPNYYYEKALIPDDPSWIHQWGPQIIGMEDVWDIQMGSSSVIVAILDTGIDYTHPDLAGQYLPLGYDFINNDNDPFDDNYHGTHCAGIIAATINNGIGIAGIADVSIIAEKTLDNNGYGTAENLASGIDHAVAQGAHIISISLGGYGYSQLVNDSVQNAITAGIMVISASGNYGTNDPYYPAALSGVFAVGATGSSDNRPYYSNYGDWLDISAPGDDIYSTHIWGSYWGDYMYDSGTSAACSHVAGLAALLLSEFPTYTPDQIYNIMETTSVDLGDPGYDIYFGWGRIDAFAAIFGLQDHNLQAKLLCPNIIPYDLQTMIEIQISNVGLFEETDINVSLIIDDVNFGTSIIPSLAPREKHFIGIGFTPGTIGTYNITGYIEPVPGEIIKADNSAQKAVEAIAKVINLQIGDILAYGYPNDFYPFSIKWEVVDILSPREYVLNYIYFLADTLTEYVYGTYILNPYTREFSSSWDLFPYWLNPDDLYLGAVVDVFYMGANDGEVIGETTYNYYGEIVDVWILDDPDEEWPMYAKYYFVKETGVRIANLDDSYNFYWEGTYISVLSPSYEVHNLKQAVDFFERNNTNFVIPILIHNTGHFAESSVTEVYIDGVFVTSRNLNLDGGEYFIWKAECQTSVHGVYVVEVNTTIVTGESYSIDNYYSIDFSTYPPVQYFMYSTPFLWYDTYHSGQSLGLAGDDIYKSINLQFEFFFYDHFFSTIYIDSNGVLSFLELDSLTWNRWGIPTDHYNYIIAPFWDDLYASNNVYYRSTPSYFAVTYWYYITTSPGYYPIGTFEVVLHANGDIVFQYHYIEYDPGSTVGLNYGRDLSYYSLYTPSLNGASDFAILFSPSPYTSFIEVNAYDSISLDPLANAQVNIYDEADNLLLTRLTDVDGFYKVVAVPVGTYRIEVIADEHFSESQVIFVDVHESIYMHFYLDPLPIREVEIITPTEGQTVEGGVVYIEFNTTDVTDVVLVDMFVNDVWITNVTSLYNDYICVPVFENGTNIIRLEFLWDDTTNAFVELSIESADITPLYDLDDGDYFMMTVEFPDVGMFIEQNFTFVWHSEFELNITSTMRTYDDNGTTLNQMQYYTRVNILNGYVTDSDIPGFISSHFALFNRITPETTIGDPFISSSWSDIVFINDSLLWRGNDVWKIILIDGTILYIHKESGFFIYEFIPTTSYGPGFGFVETNIFELVHAPDLLLEPDYEYEFGTTGHYLTWSAYDEDPAHYEIYLEGELISTDSWYSGIPISINIDALEVGVYNYTIVVMDEEGNTASDTVIVTVNPIVPELSPLLNLLFLPSIICMTLVFVLKRRKFQVTK